MGGENPIHIVPRRDLNRVREIEGEERYHHQAIKLALKMARPFKLSQFFFLTIVNCCFIICPHFADHLVPCHSSFISNCHPVFSFDGFHYQYKSPPFPPRIVSSSLKDVFPNSLHKVLVILSPPSLKGMLHDFVLIYNT